MKNNDIPIIPDGDKKLVLGKMENAGYRRCFLKEEFDIRKMPNGLYVLIITNKDAIYWQGGNVSKLEKEFF